MKHYKIVGNTAIFEAPPDCPLCIEEHEGETAAEKIYEEYAMYLYCERHSKEIKKKLSRN